jgi:hypothetical protein
MFSIFMKGRYSLSYREIEEIGRLRGLEIDHSTLQRWAIKFMPLLESQFRKRKKLLNYYNNFSTCAVTDVRAPLIASLIAFSSLVAFVCIVFFIPIFSII